MKPAPSRLDEETVQVPGTIKFPVELAPPEGFDPADLGTWPRVRGRLEWVGGRLLYMPPCGDLQQRTVADVVLVLGRWTRRTPGFVVGTNEAGIRLGDDTRGADAAVWRRDALPRPDGGVVDVPPILAVEVEGRDEAEPASRDKARWYLAHGVAVVWLLFSRTREVVVVGSGGESRHAVGTSVAPHPELPGLAPDVDELFAQLMRP